MSDYVSIPTFNQTQQVVDDQGRFTPAALRTLNSAIQSLAKAINSLAALPEIQAALAAAQQAAADAQAAAAQASQAATDNAAAVAREQALVNSGISPASVLSYDGTLIQIAAHTRQYADGTSAAVNAGSIGPGGSGVRYISYSDPTRAGGNVTYVRSTTNPVQGNDVHVVGAINVPATGTATGGMGPQRPGTVQP